MVFESIKKAFSGDDEPEYIEIDLGREIKKAKVLVRPFILKSFEDVNTILNCLREGYTIAVIDIKPLRAKDIEGSIAGFGENIILVTPQFANIHKPVQSPTQSKPVSNEEVVRE